jgi:hypothetical protein
MLLYFPVATHGYSPSISLGLLWNAGILEEPYKNFTVISSFSQENTRNRKNSHIPKGTLD